MRGLSGLFVFAGLLCTAACAMENMEVGDAPSEPVCTIRQVTDSVLLGRLNSMAIIDSTCFALCTEKQVYLYDKDGYPVRQIGQNGRAVSEYIMPTIVRSDGRFIYVWCAMSMRFIVYDKSGSFIGGYGYPSAVRDFCPSSGKIFIYPAGLRSDHIVDVYDKSTGNIEKSLGTATYTHKAMLGWMSAAPVLYDGGSLFFMPQDRLELMEYRAEWLEADVVSSFQSKTFRPEILKNALGAEDKMDYLYSNPFVVSVFSQGGQFYVLTSEGKYRIDGGHLSDDARFLSLYRMSSDGGCKIMDFRAETFGYTNLLSVYRGEIYFISHMVEDGSDVYILRKLLLNQ